MARQARIDMPEYPQHVIVRGVNRAPLFHDDVDRHVFLGQLEYGFRRYECDLHAFVLMTNHVHLLATGRKPFAISRAMQSVGRRFVKFVNERHSRTGTLFEGRFKSSLVDSDRYFLTCMRYIETNPVRAGMVAGAGEYEWSSHRSNAMGRPQPPLAPHPCYLALHASDAGRSLAYRRLFDEPVDGDDLDAIRRAGRMSRVLGSQDFQKRLSTLLNRAVAPAHHGGTRSSRWAENGSDGARAGGQSSSTLTP